ncbi:MAG: polyprenyl synthetase family protein [Acidobacteriota bacterium]|nr:polyprenyl synthetase family protein [Blastocatellia bacterium]MDW8412535.1 polyprenyl synthetase family protein [Acidobacteriota bacterium]
MLSAQQSEYLSVADVYELIKPELTCVEKQFLSQIESDVKLVQQIGKYLHLSGGKRIRPALLILSARVLGAECLENVIRMATVVEFLHTATLIHDDIIDDCDVRRGRPSVRSRWGNDIAVLSGDWLYMLAFENSLKERNFEILDILTRVTRQMTEGELIQLELRGRLDITEQEYLEIVHRKTAFLISACCEIGAILASASYREQALMREFGFRIGTAFQLADDLLDFTSSTEKLGKPAANDLREGKITLPLIYLREQAREDVMEKLRCAMNNSDLASNTSRDELLGMVESSGVLVRVRAELSRYAAEAQQLLTSLTDSVYKRALYSISNFIIGREN